MVGKPSPAKTQTAGTSKRGGKRSTSWKPGQSGNPKGSPKRGESWAEIVTRVSDMTGAEVAEYAVPLAKQLKTLGDTVTLKEAVILRVFVALMNEPTPGLLNSLMDRVEGTPHQSVTVSGDDEKPLAFRVIETDSIRAAVGIAAAQAGPESDLRAPGEG